MDQRAKLAGPTKPRRKSSGRGMRKLQRRVLRWKEPAPIRTRHLRCVYRTEKFWVMRKMENKFRLLRISPDFIDVPLNTTTNRLLISRNAGSMAKPS